MGRMTGVGAAAVLLVVSSAGEVRAQETSSGVALNQLEPAPAGDPFFAVPSPGANGDPELRAFAMFDYAKDPLTLTDESGDAAGAVVSSQSFLRVDVSLALWDRVLVSADMPFAVAQSGEDPTVDGVTVLSPSSATAGDLRLGARAGLLGAPRDAFQIGLGTYVHLPTGPSGSYAAEGAVRFAPHLALGGRASSFVWTAAAGAVVRGSGNPHTLTYGGGAALVLGDGLFQIGPEIFASSALGDAVAVVADESSGAAVLGSGSTNAEVLLGARLRLAEVLVLGAGAGTGLADAPGTAKLRVIGMLAYSPDPKPAAAPVAAPADADGDGIPDATDACPAVRGVESADPKKRGCPPPADRDKDGVPDASDACPDTAGVASSDPKKAGCPADEDGDGIPDAADACPSVAGVKSDDAKQSGCPADADGDGIPDAADKCPADKGVASANAEENGCPEDRDGDGIKNKDDACPNERGAADADPTQNGCPKQVRVTETEIVILKQVQFKFGLSGITQTVDPVSEDLLTEVRDVLQQHPEIKKIEVQGHTDNVGQAGFNQQLSQSRADAVRKWLVDNGISADKLDAKGYGSAVPLADNRTPEGRQKNRRVEFKILSKGP